MKIGKAISIELHDGQRLSLSLKETKELYRKLGKMLTDAVEGERKKTSKAEPARKKKNRIVGKRSRAISTKSSSLSSSSSKIISLSDAKRQEILAHLDKEVSATPRTLTNLLKGVSYSASQLPAIRRIIENQQGVRAKTKGKRTLYLKKKITTTAAATRTARRAKVKTAPVVEAKSAVAEVPATSSSTTSA